MLRKWVRARQVSKTTTPIVLKCSLIACATLWHLWLSTRSSLVVELLFGLTPYLALVFAWDFIGRAWLLLPAVVALGWLDIDVGLLVKNAGSGSSTAGVAKVAQLLLSLGVVGCVALVTVFLPSRSKRGSRDRS